MDLQNHKCSCRGWQVTGEPCKKKTPVKKKLKKATVDPPAIVVSSMRQLVFDS